MGTKPGSFPLEQTQMHWACELVLYNYMRRFLSLMMASAILISGLALAAGEPFLRLVARS